MGNRTGMLMHPALQLVVNLIMAELSEYLNHPRCAVQRTTNLFAHAGVCADAFLSLTAGAVWSLTNC